MARPGPIRHLSAAPTGATAVALSWQRPLSAGGEPITGYAVALVAADGQTGAYEPTGSTATTHTVRGLSYGQAFGFRVRAVNAAGFGDTSPVVYATPTRGTTLAIPAGERIPLLDADRQRLIVRLGNKDCRLEVWWQPSALSWWASLEVPTNTPAVRSRRLAVNAGVLDRVPRVLPGNLVCRDLGDTGREPSRSAFSELEPTHALVWEPQT